MYFQILYKSPATTNPKSSESTVRDNWSFDSTSKKNNSPHLRIGPLTPGLQIQWSSYRANLEEVYFTITMFKCWILLKPVLGVVDGSLHFLLNHPWTGSTKPSLQHLQCCFGLSLGVLFILYYILKYSHWLYQFYTAQRNKLELSMLKWILF